MPSPAGRVGEDHVGQRALGTPPPRRRSLTAGPHRWHDDRMSAIGAEPTAGRRPGLLRRRRVGCSLLFLSYGTILGTWTSRIPAIRHGLGLSDTSLSFAL